MIGRTAKIEGRTILDYKVIECKEILHEAFAGLLADLDRIADRTPSLQKQPSYRILLLQTRRIWQDIFGEDCSTMNDMIKLKGKYEFIKLCTEELEQYAG